MNTDDNSMSSDNDSTSISSNPNDTIGIKAYSNQTLPDFLVELRLKVNKLAQFRQLYALCKLEINYIQIITYLLTLVATLQSQATFSQLKPIS